MHLYIFIEHVMYIMTFDFVKKKKTKTHSRRVKSLLCHIQINGESCTVKLTLLSQTSLALEYVASNVALVVKNLPANAGDIRVTGSIPELGRSSGRGNGNPL